MGCLESELKQKREYKKATLKSQQAILRQSQQQLSEANERLEEAERDRRQKEEDEKTRLSSGAGGGAAGGAVVGAFITGIFTLGLGTAIGAAVGAGVGAGVGAIINAALEEEEKARREVERCRRECKSKESVLKPLEEEISSMKDEISGLSSQIQEKKELRLHYNEEAKRMKEIAVFFRRAAVFWKEFKQISDHGVNRTVLMQRIITTAQKKEDFSFLFKKSSKLVAMTFFEAWEMMETKIVDGYEFAIQF